ncbi:SIMPL domain-containing protein [Lacisediminimonas sp.]|uniref:SIMPL domain-containing protein n=1 Tax=Lacisediminimonas sp. TaxID=3060582 RepID=UPI002720BFED|nr:SIMPL domain-containing protein [Lacisediminimonas sp.]MDO8299172.1 SIMPL domain-containing protein [Lacisediminimonas sp.]
MNPKHLVVQAFLVFFSSLALAQAAVQGSGTLVVVPAYGEVKQANNEARLVLMIEEQDKDKAQAASRVNAKMKRGTELVRQHDRSAKLQTRGYYSFPVYADEQPRTPQQTQSRPRQLVGWRVGQYLDVTTLDLVALPAMVASAQTVLAISNLNFGLSDNARRKLDEQRIAAAYVNLRERIEYIARAMGRSPGDAVLDTIDFEGSGNYAPESAAPKMTMRAASTAQVEEPSFEPGETTLQMRVVARFRFR